MSGGREETLSTLLSFVVNLKLFPQKEVLKSGGDDGPLCAPVHLQSLFSDGAAGMLGCLIKLYLVGSPVIFSHVNLSLLVYLSLRTKPLKTYCDKCIKDTFFELLYF